MTVDPMPRLQVRVPPPARRVVAVALAVGVAGDSLLRGGPWGLGFAFWVGVAVVAAVLSAPTARDRRAWAVELAPAFLLALGPALRDSPMLRAWDAFGVALWLVVPVVRRSGVRAASARIGDFVVGAFRAGVGALKGPLVLSAEPAAGSGMPAEPGRPVRTRAGSHVAVGALLALALLLVFGALLRSADAAFDRVIRLVWRWDVDVALAHVAVAAALTWLALGYLATLRRPAKAPVLAIPFTLGRLEVALPLGALAGLFLVFDAVQAQYVLGGSAFVRDTLGLTFAEHARRGFFQLIAAAALLLAVLTGVRALLRRDDEATSRTFRRYGSLVLAAAAPIPVSAFWRLGLYVEAYGLTEGRFYASAVMAWVVWCLMWLALAIARRQPGRFAAGAWVAGFVTLTLVNAVNPDALIARVNLERAAQGTTLDATYLSRLSADAAPIILGRPYATDAATRCALIARWTAAGGDWRSWNLGRWRARAMAAACGPGPAQP